jgi:predicted Zn-dependent protease
MLIRDGELADPVQETTLTFTLEQLLTTIAALGDDRRYYPFGGALGGSTMSFGPVHVTGS